MTNDAGIMDQQDVAERQAAGNDGMLEVLQRKTLERVSLKSAKKAEGPSGSG
jgi:hypothetical protein